MEEGGPETAGQGKGQKSCGNVPRQGETHSCQHIWNHVVGKMKHHANCSMSLI